jgi:RNA polymerase sigma factor (sigma-70 family)
VKKRKSRSKPGKFITQNRLPKEKPSLAQVIREYKKGTSRKEKDVREGEDYWEWMEKYGAKDDDGNILESPQANPDILANGDVVPAGVPSDSDIEYVLTREAINTVLTEKERHIMMLVIDGFSEEKIAHNLGIKQPSVSAHLKKARIKLKKYVKENS